MSAMKRIIIAEDIKTILEKDRSFFNRSGIIAVPAASNEEILTLHTAEKADLIIMNLDMPGMSGEHLCSVIRTDDELRNVSIIVVCSETAENLQRCTQCGANAFISSPVNTAVLLQEAYQLLHVTPRRECRVPLKLKMEGISRGKPITGQAENISASGMLFQSAAELYEGDTLTCSFALAGSRRLSAGAEVVRVSKKGQGTETVNHYGIVFVDITDDDISVIEAFVRNYSRTHSTVF
jgi:CheY-like chemotaxis protein